jgi:predicted RNase H-like HicB family nuclease
MTRRFYPAVLERGPKHSFGAWFPDFPDCVVGATSQEETLERAQSAVAREVVTLAEHEKPLPDPTPIEKIEIPQGCDFIAVIVVSVEWPDVSERVNVYLPKQLIERADKRASQLGMNRSSFFGLALSSTLAGIDLNADPGLRAAVARLSGGKKSALLTKLTGGKRITKK